MNVTILNEDAPTCQLKVFPTDKVEEVCSKYRDKTRTDVTKRSLMLLLDLDESLENVKIDDRSELLLLKKDSLTSQWNPVSNDDGEKGFNAERKGEQFASADFIDKDITLSHKLDIKQEELDTILQQNKDSEEKLKLIEDKYREQRLQLEEALLDIQDNKNQLEKERQKQLEMTKEAEHMTKTKNELEEENKDLLKQLNKQIKDNCDLTKAESKLEKENMHLKTEIDEYLIKIKNLNDQHFEDNEEMSIRKKQNQQLELIQNANIDQNKEKDNKIDKLERKIEDLLKESQSEKENHSKKIELLEAQISRQLVGEVSPETNRLVTTISSLGICIFDEETSNWKHVMRHPVWYDDMTSVNAYESLLVYAGADNPDQAMFASVINLKDKTVKDLQSIPFKIRAAGIGIHENQITLVGGEIYQNGKWSLSNKIYEICIDGSEWIESANLMEEISRPTVLCTDNSLYVFGGENKTGELLGSVYCHNNTTRQWSILENLPEPASSMCGRGFMRKNCIYVMGKHLYMSFNTKDQQWQSQKHHKHVDRITGVWYRGRIVCSTQVKKKQKVYNYDLAQNQWGELTNISASPLFFFSLYY